MQAEVHSKGSCVLLPPCGMLLPSLTLLVMCRSALICCCSVAHMCLTLRDPIDCSTPGFPVLHHFPEFAQTHFHCVNDIIHPCTAAVFQRVKNLPAVQEIRVQSLGWDDPLEKEVATHSSILAWRIPGMEEPVGLQSMGSQRV